MIQAFVFDCYGVLYRDGKMDESLLSAIQKLSKDTIILTSMSRRGLEELFEPKSSLDYVTRSLSYEDIQFSKADPRCYQELRKKLNLNPEQVWFIDDTPANVAAAELAGLQAVLFTTSEAVLKQLEDMTKIT